MATTCDTVAIMSEPVAPAPSPEPINLSALLTEALAKSSVCWIDGGDGPRAAWFVTLGGAVLVVTGPGEQNLPALGEEARILLRSKDSGGRLLEVRARVRELYPQDPAWADAAAALAAERLNATDDLVARWAASGTIYQLRPFALPLQSPGEYAAGSGSEVIEPGRGTTDGWRPFHVRGRAQARRNRRTSAN